MERCGFFDAHLSGEEYDRVYLAQHFAAYFASFIANGVFAEHSNQLQVMEMPTPQMQIGVERGQGWINGYWYENTDILYLPVDVADGVLNRIDSVVLRLGFSERNMWLAVKKGTPAVNPIAPEVTRNADYYELQLATISIPASSIKITQAQITDTRMNQDVCGWVTGVVKQLDTTTLFNQFESYFDEFKQLSESEFDSWFESIKGKLSGDIAGSLQNQIDAANEKIDTNTNNIATNTSAIDTLNSIKSETFTTVYDSTYISEESIRVSKSMRVVVVDISFTTSQTVPAWHSSRIAFSPYAAAYAATGIVLGLGTHTPMFVNTVEGRTDIIAATNGTEAVEDTYVGSLVYISK